MCSDIQADALLEFSSKASLNQRSVDRSPRWRWTKLSRRSLLLHYVRGNVLILLIWILGRFGDVRRVCVCGDWLAQTTWSLPAEWGLRLVHHCRLTHNLGVSLFNLPDFPKTYWKSLKSIIFHRLMKIYVARICRLEDKEQVQTMAKLDHPNIVRGVAFRIQI